MKPDYFIAFTIVALVGLCVVGSCSPSCSIRPALINWERREKPLFPNLPRNKNKTDRVTGEEPGE